MLNRYRLIPAGLGATATIGLFALLTGSVSAQQSEDGASAASIRERLVGIYALGEYAAHGDEPTGRIYYDEGGRMSAMLFPPGREEPTRDTPDEDFRGIMSGVVAYFGTYTIDVEGQRVIHHVEAASNPAWIGDDFVRWYRFEGDDLRISLGESFENSLLWVRLPEEL